MRQITNIYQDPDELFNLAEDISTKVRNWAIKQMDKLGGEDKLVKDAIGKLIDAGKDGATEIAHITEWTPSLKKDKPVTWIRVVIAMLCNQRKSGCLTMAAPLLLEDEGLSTVIEMDPQYTYNGEHKLDEVVMLAFSAHFFNRYVERVLGGLWPKTKIDLLVKFFRRNPIYIRPGTYKIYDKALEDGREVENVDVCFSHCIGRGHVVRGRKHLEFIMDTCISWDTLSQTQYRDLIPLMDKWKEEVETIYGKRELQNDGNKESHNSVDSQEATLSPFEWKHGEPFIDTSKDKRPDLKYLHAELNFKSRQQTAKYVGLKSTHELDAITCYVVVIQCIFQQIANIDVKAKMFKDADTAKRVIGTLGTLINSTFSNITFKGLLVGALTRISENLELDVEHEVIKDYIYRMPYDLTPETYEEIKARSEKDAQIYGSTDLQNNETNKKNINRINNDVMNKKQITECKAIITSHVKNFEQMFNGMSIKISAESYLSQVAPLFAIGRLVRTNGLTPARKKKYQEADKEWVEKVVDNDWCNELKPYVEKFGKELVTLAIHHLMDCGKWLCPTGITGLKPEHYECLEYIDEAAQFICEEEDIKPNPVNLTQPSTEEGAANTDEGSESSNITALVDFVDSEGEDRKMFVSVREAKSSMKSVLHNIDRLQAHMEQLEAFVNNQSETENTKAQEEVQRLTVALADKNRAYDTLKQTKDKLTEDNATLQSDLNGVKSELNTVKQARDNAEAELRKKMGIIKTQGENLISLRNEFDKFKEQAKVGVLVLPGEILKSKCPNIGRGSRHDLADVLKELFGIETTDID